MALLNSKTADTVHDLLDYKVVDQVGEEIGSVHSFWADPQTGNLQFVGVKTGWLFGQNHVIPIDRVETDDANRTLRIPYSAELVKGALSIDADSEITDAQEEEIYRYYEGGGRTASTTSSTSSSSLTDTAHGAVNRGEAAVASAAGAVTGAVSNAASKLTGSSKTETTGTTGTSTASTNTNRTTATGNDTIEVPLTEEEVKVGKRQVSGGQVRLRKIVRTEVVNQPVEIRHEDVVVERISADQVKSGTANSDFKEEVIDVPLTREEVVVSKDAHVTGAVRLNKTSTAETQNVSETVRKEDVEVLRDGETIREERDLKK